MAVLKPRPTRILPHRIACRTCREALSSRRACPCRRPAPPSDFSIFRICTNCLSRRFTSSTDVPLPFAMRLRRLPLITWWLPPLARRHRRDDGLDAVQAASRRACCSASCLMFPIPGIIPRMLSSGPIFRIVRSWSRKSSSVNSSPGASASSRCRVLDVDGRFGLLDERQHVAHPQHAARRRGPGERPRDPPAARRCRQTRSARRRPRRPRAPRRRARRHRACVSTTPVTPTRRLNSPALLIASCPVIASAT